jgi:hypothetical protein
MSFVITHGRIPLAAMSLLAFAWDARCEGPAQPPPHIAELEVMRGDINETGSCYSLASVVEAARIGADAGETRISWIRRGEYEWTLRAMVKGQWREYTFRREGSRLLPVHSDLPDHEPGVNLEKAVDELLASTHDGSVSRVPRCGGD